ncbi:hypothetical protein PV327_000150 [Microctonus hyperodae]|uniref:Peptidase M12B domain-containing protein n=1 Tax=Microctonus hyperodae TaxID=165561 RepID=A0AA39L1U8_MICHY|nr:hypothetical protein PV327_000150 [Microctonus hyperodae]
MRGFICANVCIGILLVSIEISAALERAMKLSWPYIHVEYYNAYQNDRSKRQIGAIELEHLVTPVSTKNRIHDITGRNNESESSSRTKRSNSDIVYPEILSNIGLSYISSNKKDSGRLAVDTAYHDSTVWLYDNLDSIIDRNKYDVAVTITSLSLCYNNGNSGLCKDPGPSRYGQLGNACKVDDSNRRIFKTIIVYDKGAYTGIYAATDELKHVFGVDHDSAPSTIKCNSMDGTATKSGKAAAQVRHWSKCSLTALEKFITTSGSCFYNQPELSYKLMPYLPGKIKNADQQCKALEGTKSYKTDAKLCRSLYCYFRNSNNTLVANHGQAPSGTRCGHKKMCLNTECVTEPEMNLIPQPPTAHSEVVRKIVPITFNTSEILTKCKPVRFDHSHISEETVQGSLHMKPFDNNYTNFIYPPDWALFTLDTPVYAIRNSSNDFKFFVYKDAMKLYLPYMNIDYYYAHQNERKKRQIDDIELKHLVKPVPIENGIDDTTWRNNTSESSSRTKRSSSDIVYPEILSNVGLSYISSNKNASGYLIAYTAINDFTYWLYDNINSIIDRNNLPMCIKNAQSGLCDGLISGLAHSGRACHVDDNSHVVLKVAITQDNGAFSGIQAATHELAHVFGAEHDNEPPTYQCNSIDRTVMNTGPSGIPVEGWSKCSLAAMEKYIKKSGSCLYNQPELSNKFRLYLPGKIQDIDQQCKVLEGTKASEFSENICQSRYCYGRNSNYTVGVDRGPAPPGTRCGHEKFCLKYKCVAEPKIYWTVELPEVHFN